MEWRSKYNTVRPHEALELDVPASRYQPSTRRFPEILPEMVYAAGEVLRRVGTTKAYVSFMGRLWKVPLAFKGETVAIRPSSKDGHHKICFGATKIAEIDLTSMTEKET